MITPAYWISPQGKILDVGISKHIDHFITYPESFGVTREQIQATYAKHNEKIGMEGKAREELILQAINHGFIRVRLYQNSRWSITLNNINNKINKNILQRWAQLPSVQKDKYMPVFILDMSTGRLNKDYTVEHIAEGKHLLEGESFLIKLIAVNDAGEFGKLSFKEFIGCN